MGRVFIDRIGFREPGVRLTAPATATNAAGRALTVTALVSTAEATDLIYEIEWHGEQDFHPQGDRVVLHGADIDAACRPRGMNMAVRHGKLVLTHALPPVGEGVRRVELEVAGSEGAWRVPLELEPFGLEAGLREVDASDTLHGITIAVRGIAHLPDATVFELVVSFEGLRRRVDIGGLNGLRDEVTALRLRDVRGGVYAERTRNDARDQLPDPTGRADVAVFGSLAPDAGALTLEVPSVSVNDFASTADVALPVTDPVNITLAGARLRVLRTRETEIDTPQFRGAAIAVDLDASWHEDRRIIWPTQAKVDGASRGVGTGGGMYAPAPEPLTTLTIPCDSPSTARVLTLGGAFVQLRGPWRIPIPAFRL